MSRIGRLPIPVPTGVDVAIDGRHVTVKGPKGQLSHSVAAPIEVAQEDGTLTVTRPDDERVSRALHGLTRTPIANMVTGVTQGYEKNHANLGTAYRDAARASTLESARRYSHLITIDPTLGLPAR